MATVNFIVRGNKNPSSILLRFKHSNLYDISCSTSLLVNPIHWSQKKQKIKDIAVVENRDQINEDLHELRQKIINKFNGTNSNGGEINLNWLKFNIELHFDRTLETEEHKIYFSAYFKKFINDSSTRILKSTNKPPSPLTISKYKTTYSRIIEFEMKNGRLKLSDIDLNFHKQYLSFMFKYLIFSGNTVGKDIGVIKAVCNEAKTDGLPVNPKFESKSFFAPKEETFDVYLNEEEIGKIFSHNFRGNERLDNTRDIFIIGLRTGLRVSDFKRLDSSLLHEDRIRIITKKTKSSAIIPLHPQVKSVLNKRGGNFPRMISDVKFNEYVKEVCELVGLTELEEGAPTISIKDPRDPNKTVQRKVKGMYPKYKLISSHSCRRSFASNLYGKIETPTIMAITGHKQEANLLKYIKIKPEVHAKNLEKHWDKEAKERRDNQETLKIV